MSESFLNGRVTLHAGDSRDVLKTLADDSIDSIVTDPPYALVSIVKRFGAKGAAACIVPEGGSGAYARASAGFMGKAWDTGETAFASLFWAECLRVLKPGGHVVAFSGTRTYHRMACAIEDAGFEVRDMLQYLYGSGFPKSHDVSKGIDKALGGVGTYGEPKSAAHAGWINRGRMRGDDGHEGYQRPWMQDEKAVSNAARKYEGGDELARKWQGWGTALKPACEPILLGRKPMGEKTVAANVLKWGTGAINVDGCRVGFANEADRWKPEHHKQTNKGDGYCGINNGHVSEPPTGRFPANIIHDGSDEVVAAFPDVNTSRSTVTSTPGLIYGGGAGLPSHTGTYGADESGSAARFFYTAKADQMDRLGSKHPTVKPVDLMQWLCRLVTPKGGTVLDPFAGTGTTAEAAYREGFNAVLIEREAEYQADIRRRMGLVLGGPDERARESIKARTAGQPIDHGPLFGSLEAAE